MYRIERLVNGLRREIRIVFAGLIIDQCLDISRVGDLVKVRDKISSLPIASLRSPETQLRIESEQDDDKGRERRKDPGFLRSLIDQNE